MKVIPIRTHKITAKDTSIFSILDTYLPRLKEGTVVAVTSKIVSICEGSLIDYASENLELKDKVIKEEAELYVPRTSNKYNVLLTIKGGAMSFSSGVDESNANGHLILWPKNPQKSANEMREHLARKYKLKKVGVVITDTASVPLRWGQRGVFVLAYSGFSPLNSYIGKPDIFGRKLKMTSAAIADPLGTAAVLVMGEGKEQTPLAIIEDIPFVRFQSRNPTQKDLNMLNMPLEDDLYAPLLTAVKWKKGGCGMQKRVVVFGTFDGVHEGHRDFFRQALRAASGQAREKGTELIAIVARDAIVEKLKHKKPKFSEIERAERLRGEPLVSRAVLGDKELSTYKVLQELKPDIVCFGYDQIKLAEDLKKWAQKTGAPIQFYILKPHKPEIFHTSKIQ